jgi:YD repeat-containing protein
VTDTKGNCFTYEYDDRHNVTQGTSAQGMIYQMTYDAYGNIIRSGPKKASGSNVGLWMKRTMDETLHSYVTEVKDTYGNTVHYQWNTQKDLLTSVEDGKGNVLSYGYDSADHLTSVSQQVKAYGETAASTVTNTYEYDKDRLTKIGHNGFHYQFFQDAFGNTSRVSIAGNEVISHTYEEHNGKPLKVVYGNGAQLRYEYDKEERVEAVYYQESSTASEQLYQSFVYGKDGSLDQVTDHLSGKTYDLDYDFLDRLMRVRDESGNYYERRTSNPPLQMRGALSGENGGCSCQMGIQNPI